MIKNAFFVRRKAITRFYVYQKVPLNTVDPDFSKYLLRIITNLQCLTGSTSVPRIKWLNSFPIVRNYQLELRYRLSENRSALLKLKC